MSWNFLKHGVCASTSVCTVTATGRVIYKASCSLSCVTTTTIVGLITRQGISSLNCIATVNSTGAVTHRATGNISCIATVIGYARVTHSGVSALACIVTMTDVGRTGVPVNSTVVLTAGNAVIVNLSAYNSVGDIGIDFSVTDTLLNAWLPLNAFTPFGDNSVTQTFYCLNCIGGSTTIIGSHNGMSHSNFPDDNVAIVVVEISGANAIDGYATATGTTAPSGNTTLSSGDCTVTDVNDIMLSFLGLDGLGPLSFAVASDFIEDIAEPGDGVPIRTLEHKNISSSAAARPPGSVFSDSTDGRWATSENSMGYAVTAVSLITTSSGTYDFAISSFTQGFTYSFWFTGPDSESINPSVIAATYPITDDLYVLTTPRSGWMIYTTVASGAAYLNIDFNSVDGGVILGAVTASTLIDTQNYTDKFYHAAIVVKYTNSEWSVGIYINGHTSGFSSINGHTFLDGTDLILGGIFDEDGALNTDQTFIGELKDFRLYNRPLIDGEIFAIWSRPEELYRQPSLIPWYSLIFIKNGDGGLVLGGSASAKKILTYTSTGGLKLGGIAAVKGQYSYTATGGLLLNSFPSFSTAIGLRSPLVWYRFNDLSGTTAINSGTLGSAMNGTYHGDFTLQSQSLIFSDQANKSVYFGGSTSYVSTPSNVNINSSTPYSKRTIELWIKTSSDVVGRQTIYAEGDTVRGFGIYLFSNIITVIIWNLTADSESSAWGTHYAMSSPTIEPNTIYHIALSYNAFSSILIGYLNGQIFGYHTGDIEYIGSHAAISIGANTNGTIYSDGANATPGERFKNLIDEVIIYSQYSTPSDIAFDYRASIPVAYGIFNYSYTATGGLKLGGTGALSNLYVYTATGGLVISGQVNTNPHYQATGGLIFSGHATIVINSGRYTHIATGGLIVSGQSDNNPHHYATGGLKISGEAGIQANLDISQDFTWNINADININQDFTWNVSAGILRFYQVTTICKPQGCPPLQTSDSCNKSTIVTIAARSIADVCTQLTSAGITDSIYKIERYSNPIFSSDFTFEDNLSCNRLEDVTPQFESISCSSLILPSLLSNIGASCVINGEIFSYTGTGGFVLGRGNKSLGGFKLGGSATVTTPHYLGLSSVSMGGYSDVTELSSVLSYTDVSSVMSDSLDSINTPCATDVPVILYIAHDLNSITSISNFLRRNKLLLSSVLKLSWSDLNNSWQGNVHFVGIAELQDEMERLDIFFDLSCNNVYSSFYGDNAWLFRLVINFKNLSTDEVTTSNLLIDFISSDFKAPIDFDFTVNVFEKKTNIPSKDIIFYDNGVLGTFLILSFRVSAATLSPSVVSSSFVF